MIHGEIDTSRHFCAGVMREHARSFFLATRFLPRAKREAIEALYAFFRCVDDTADEGDASITWRRIQLDRFRRDLDGLARPKFQTTVPWFSALRRAYDDFALDIAPLRELIDGCERDLDGVEITSMADLRAYAWAVAGTVGRSVIPILGAADSGSLALAADLGIAMQYTNILRDVREDTERGRNYLPSQPGEQRSQTMARVAREAHALYESTGVLAQRLPNDGSRAALLMASMFYQNILRSVERRGFDPQAERAYVGGMQKVSLAAKCFLLAYTGLAIIK